MILNLYIENLVLIDKLEVELSEGLNIITGETGAGKSIIFDAIGFVLGDKCSKDIIKTGKEKAVVKCTFCLKNEILEQKLNDYGIEYEEDEIIVERELNATGRSVFRLNGKIIASSILKDIRKYMVDIHSQHEHQGLLNEESHIEFLDNFIGDEVKQFKKICSEKFWELRSIETEIKRIQEDEKERERSIDMLEYQINEIDEAGLKSGEEEELQKQKMILQNSQKISENMANAYNTLNGGNGYNKSVIDNLSDVLNYVKNVESYDESIENISKIIEDAYYSLEECKNNIRDYADSMEFNEEQFNYVIDRIDMINKLKRKYGETIEEIINYREEIAARLKKLINFKEELGNLVEKKEKFEKELETICEKISDLRKKYAIKLETNIKNQLDELDMKSVNLKIEIKKQNVTSKGFDNVEFIISTNVGEPFRSLSKIVSGGELSRIMLAIKVVLSKIDMVDTMLFDEIDSGISGKAAWAVSQKLGILANDKQLLSITHLPQIASMGDKHFMVKKYVEDGITYSSIVSLKEEERFIEISRLLDGSSCNSMTIEHARQMYEECNKFKKLNIGI